MNAVVAPGWPGHDRGGSAVSPPCPILEFLVELQPRRDLDEAARDTLSRLIEELLAARGLLRVPERPGYRWSFVVQSEAAQLTDMDREAVFAWAHRRPEVARVDVGPIVDRDSRR